jgi:hypothetical protein
MFIPNSPNKSVAGTALEELDLLIRILSGGSVVVVVVVGAEVVVVVVVGAAVVVVVVVGAEVVVVVVVPHSPDATVGAGPVP